MSPPTYRLLPFTLADGAIQMAADEVMLEAAAAGVVSLRFYGWKTATLSLGYFQPEALRHKNPRVADLPFVRRPTGGEALVHHHEMTYALALPKGGTHWLCRMHRLITAALKDLGLKALTCPTEQPSATGLLCFQHHTPGDVILNGAKIVGSAQRRWRQALLQHGSILLAASPFTPELPGLKELTGQTFTTEDIEPGIMRHLMSQTGWTLPMAAWTPAEEQRIAELVQSRYGHDSWNCKR